MLLRISLYTICLFFISPIISFTSYTITFFGLICFFQTASCYFEVPDNAFPRSQQCANIVLDEEQASLYELGAQVKLSSEV